jgi:hypothetical protein
MGYFDCQKAAVVKRAPQASQSPSAHILQRVLLFAFDSAPHLGHFAKIWGMLMFLLVSIFKGFLTEETRATLKRIASYRQLDLLQLLLG